MRRRLQWTAQFIALAAAFMFPLVLTAPGVAATSCANEELRSELHSGELPDCRAYEMVSPPYKEGAVVYVWAMSPDGSRILGQSFGVVDGAESDEIEGTGEAATYVFTRGLQGWTTETIAPPAWQFPSGSLATTTPELSSTLWLLRTLEQPNQKERDVYLRTQNGTFVSIGPTQSTPGEPEVGEETSFAGASRSLGNVFFTLDANADGGAFLWPGDTTLPVPESARSLYEYSGTGNSEPVLVGVRNEGRLEGHPHINEGAELITQCGTVLGSEASADNAVSESGNTVFFTALGLKEENCGGKFPAASGPEFAELYARVAGSETLAISEPSMADCEACDTTSGLAPAAFQGASEDGSKAFFTTAQELLPGAAGANLYEYEVDPTVNEATGETEFTCPKRPDGCVTLVSSGTSSAEVKGVARISEDGSRVYYVAGGVLTGANAEGHAPVKGANNFYVYDTVTGTTRFIGTLASDDGLVWYVEDRSRPVESTPDGEFLVFTSSADLTAGDTSTAAQVFEYDARTERLRRVSVGQDGYDDDGNTTEEADAASIGSFRALPVFEGVTSASHTTARAMSDDGSRVFFESADALTPQTLPGLPSNVYEWEAEGTGSCAVGDGEGCVYLISDGRDDSRTQGGTPSTRWVATDASGEDALFETADQLVPADTDTQLDLYDARVGGGFAEPQRTSECGGSACQAPLETAPAPALVQTATSEDEAPQSVGGVSAQAAVKTKPLTRAQLLARALASCRAEKVRSRRVACEARARRRYGPKAKKSQARKVVVR
jgi:hypothetical protein